MQADGMRFFCQTCPYLFQINEKVEKKVPLQRKQVDDVLGGDEAWENVDQTESASLLPLISSFQRYHLSCAH